MTSIFATALNAIKTNPRRSSGAPTSKPKEVHRQDDSDKSGSILDRIKLKKPAGKTIKKIELHREDSSDEERFKVIHKVIKKDKNIELNRPMVKKGDIDGQWKHDKYDGPTISSSTSLVTVFVRNLPDSVDKDSLMYLCREYDSVIGIKVLFHPDIKAIDRQWDSRDKFLTEGPG